MAESSKRRGKHKLHGLVQDSLAEAHTELTASGGIPKDQAGELLGADVVRQLTDLGLAHVVPHTADGPATFQAVRTDLALTGLLARFHTQVAQDTEQILLCVERLQELLPVTSRGGQNPPGNLVRIITDKDEACKLSMELIHTTSHNWMMLENTYTDMPITEDFDVHVPPALRGKARFRAIYDQAAVEHPVLAKHIERAIAEGEEARVIKTVVMKLKLSETAALLPLSPTGSGGVLLIRGTGVPVLVMLRDYFEMLWATAIRIGSDGPPPGSPLTPEQGKVLRLMAAGLTDEAITRRLELSQSTVHRHINAILAELKVPSKSRFVAGAIAQKRGWLPDDLDVRNG
jgi:DNA-binding CsgD family transcriptional regulator